ncbi:2-oxo acid dehydrogenase subunit E2 [Streptosporangium longisporum]|uniref:Dihydrolipoamide acetyltransferase component of pyruvate dehydrogenase complex n=1 Tax=Streptosporangium longisporum TaxID=46187 RepID=A0ABP6L0P9_9ACTN
MTEIRVPKLNNNDATYVLVEWVAKDGQEVRTGEVLAELETSKAVEELTAEQDGTLRHLLAAGAECAPGQVIALLPADGTGPDADLGTGLGAGPEATPRADPGAGVTAGRPPSGPSSEQNGHAAPVADQGGLVITEPARRFMDESGISMERVRALGRKVIRRADLEPLVPSPSGPGTRTTPDAPDAPHTPGAAAGVTPPAGTGPYGDRARGGGADVDGTRTGGTEVRQTAEAGKSGEAEEIGQAGEAGLIEPSRAQRRTAEVVERSHREIPASFTEMRVDVTDALPFTRAETKRLRALIGMPELLVQATGRLLEDFPVFFATPLDGYRARRATTAEVGVTVDVGNGMYVPVVRDAGRRPLDEIARDLTRFRATALNGAFRERDLVGGNIMVTLHTDASVTTAVPIVFPGQICALSLTAPRPETVQARDGSFVTRRVISLGLSYDHRYVNGRDAAEFLGALRTSLEKPGPTTA